MEKNIYLFSLLFSLFWMALPVMGNATSFHADNDIETAWEILLSNLEQEISGEYDDVPVVWQSLPVDNPVVPKGTCYYRSHPESYKKIKYLLLPQLSGLNQCENVIIGQCYGKERKECFIRITHSIGESKSYFELRFKAVFDKIIMDSLYCEITP